MRPPLRAAAVVEAYALAGVFGSDPELLACLGELIQHARGGKAMACDGVSVPFFVRVLRALEAEFGNRALTNAEMEEIRHRAATMEAVYCACPRWADAPPAADKEAA